jgi:hypothetical protein
LHKGGSASGVFLQLTAPGHQGFTDTGAAYTFSTLKQAQALGDFRSLSPRADAAPSGSISARTYKPDSTVYRS